MSKFLSPTAAILIALLAGIATGAACHTYLPDPSGVASGFSLISSVFLRLIKMIIAPLVLSTLAAGVARMGDASVVRRTGVKALLWFAGASLVSMSIGLLLADALRPGDGFRGAAQATAAALPVSGSQFTAEQVVAHIVPSSIVDSMARNEILHIVVFAVLLGAAAASMGRAADVLVELLDSLAQATLRITGFIMRLAPLAVFAAVASVLATKGLGAIPTYAVLVVEFYFGVLLLWAVLLIAGRLVLGVAVMDLLRLLKPPILLAFSTASSEAALPQVLDRLEQFGVPRRLAAFVLPLGYSFNLDGSMLYATFATIFIAQAQGIELPVGTQIAMLMMLMVTSKGLAGVPRAVLVVIAATLAEFQIPQEGLLLLLGVDHFLDMARSATNVLGNGIACAVVARWEGQLSAPPPELGLAEAAG